MPHQFTPLTAVAQAVAVGERELISIVGGGGKTTTLFALGRQLGGPSILTTTTKMGSDRDEGVRVLVGPNDQAVRTALHVHRSVLVWSERSGHRADGVGAERCDRWFDDRAAPYVVVEADGSRRRPFKAPYAYEPVVPASTTLMLACIGISAIGRPIAESCHRPDAVVAIVGGSERDLLTPAKAAAVLCSDAGSRKGLPNGARYIVLAQQARVSDQATIDALVQEVGDFVQVIPVAASSETT